MKIGLYGKSRRSTNNNLMVCSNIYIFKWIPYIYYFCFPFIFQHLVLLMLPVPWDGSSFCYVFIQCLSQWVIWQRLLDTTVVVKSTRHCQLSLWNRRKFIHVTLVYLPLQGYSKLYMPDKQPRFSIMPFIKPELSRIFMSVTFKNCDVQKQ